jgi:hypothetical protein
METRHVRSQADIENLPLRRYADAVTPALVRRISWGAALAGTAVGMVTQLWLTMLGVAIGASTIDPLKEANPLDGMGIGSAVWLGVSLIISSYVGGWVAGRLAGIPKHLDSALHGAVSWASANIAAFLLMGTVFGAIAGGTAKIAGGALSGAGQAATAVGQAAGGSNEIERNLNQLVDQAQQQGRAIVNQAQNPQRRQQFEQEARQAGDTTAKAVSGTGWGIVIAMFLGLCAGVGGAYTATPRNPLIGSRR